MKKVHEVPRAVTYNGTHTALSELCRQHNVSYQLVYSRLRAGWTVENALQAPPRQSKPSSRELRRYEYLGQMLTIEELAQKSLEIANETAVPGPLIRARILKGWTIEDAVEVSPLPKGSRRKPVESQGQQGACPDGTCPVTAVEPEPELVSA